MGAEAIAAPRAHRGRELGPGASRAFFLPPSVTTFRSEQEVDDSDAQTQSPFAKGRVLPVGWLLYDAVWPDRAARAARSNWGRGRRSLG